MRVKATGLALLAALACGTSEAAIVEAHLNNSTSVLEVFHELLFPADPAVGMQATEVFGANVIQTNRPFTVRYDSDFFTVVLETNYHSESAQVGTRVYEYTGMFDPETNELLGASWMVISENILEQSFEVGASSQRLVQTGGLDPDDPPPPPPEFVPLPPSGLLLAVGVMGGLLTARRRTGASR